MNARQAATSGRSLFYFGHSVFHCAPDLSGLYSMVCLQAPRASAMASAAIAIFISVLHLPRGGRGYRLKED